MLVEQDHSSIPQDPKPVSTIDIQVSAIENEQLLTLQKSSDPPYLLTIPPEIRAEILKYVLVSPEPIRIDEQYYRPKWYRDFPVAWTCHQIHAEAIPIYLTQNTFSFLIGNRAFERLKRRWLKRIGEKNWPLIRSVKLRPWPLDTWPDLDLLRGLQRIDTGDQTFDLEGYGIFSENGKRMCQYHEIKQTGWRCSGLCITSALWETYDRLRADDF